MLNLYLGLSIVGGILLAASIFLGGDGDADADLGADVDGDLDGSDAGDIGGFFGVVFSLRFWTFFSAFGGLTGVVFTFLEVFENETATLLVALGVGLLLGYLATFTLRWLGTQTSGEVAGARDYAGREARVLVKIHPGGPGKVRLELSGTTVDMLARAEGDEVFLPEARVVVLRMENEQVIVAGLD